MLEAWLPERVGRNARLERLTQLIDWAPLEALVAELHAAPVGRPRYPPLLMVKVLLLQQWDQASDPAIEEALWERLSFRRFVGLGLAEDAPDHSTISRFRTQVSTAGLAEALFAEVEGQLAAQGLLVREGTLLDATVVEAQVRRPRGRDADAPKDPDAAWTRRGAHARYGYKVHVGVDAGSELVRRAVLTPANVNETEVADALIVGDEAAVYGDAAYGTHARHARLRALGIKDRLMQRPSKHHPQLRPSARRRHALIEQVRRPIEHLFGTLKRSYGYRRVRYVGLARNSTELWFKLLAYNLRRADRLLAPAAAGP
jgi:IS5 family transposase